MFLIPHAHAEVKVLNLLFFLVKTSLFVCRQKKFSVISFPYIQSLIDMQCLHLSFYFKYLGIFFEGELSQLHTFEVMIFFSLQQLANGEGGFENVELGVIGKKKKIPRRVIHFASGETMEEYSTDEEEDEQEKKDLLPPVDPVGIFLDKLILLVYWTTTLI